MSIAIVRGLKTLSEPILKGLTVVAMIQTNKGASKKIKKLKKKKTTCSSKATTPRRHFPLKKL